MKKILIIASHRNGRSPNQRFRFEHYFSYWQSRGYQVKVSYFISAVDDQYLYRKGYFFRKMQLALKSIFHRFFDLFSLYQYDIVIVVRESLLTRSVFFERVVHWTGKPMIYDFDDAIWLRNVSESNKKLTWLKNPSKTKKSIRLSNIVFAGNEFLRQYALQFNSNALLFPTTLDTQVYKKIKQEENKPEITIGWSGSPTTIDHFKLAEEALEILKEKYGALINIVVMGAPQYQNELLNIHGIPWTAESELEILSTFDIGLMPLPNDEWSKGKCGFKALLYMSLGIPPVVSPVGVNNAIINDGYTGYFASNTNEWVQKLSLLIDNISLRKSFGEQAREFVIDHYSVEAWKEKYIEQFDILTNKYANK